jgi:murein DD-endopeptidase MepM/ murein hydrolase activator NlpD
MRSRALTFLAGFVSGGIVLYVWLWTGGVLKPYLTRVRAQNVSYASTPAKVAPPQALAPPPAGSIDKPGAMALPIAGLTAAQLQDTFDSARPGGRAHQATDILAPRGTPVHAMVDGAIQKLFYSKAGGNTIYEFDEGGVYCYYYAHLDGYAAGLTEGQHARRGDVIGYVGTTGDASPDTPHLHLAIFKLGPEKQWWKGEAINPYPVLMELLK